MGLLARFKESAAIRCVEAALRQAKPADNGVEAARRLGDVGSDRCIPILKQALFQDNLRLQIQAARAFAAIYKRHPDPHILEILNVAILNERQSAQARQAIVESLAEITDIRRSGGLVEVLKSARTPATVRSAALGALKSLNYPEILERLVESAIFGKILDPRGEIRTWATSQLIALDDRDKLHRIFEIIHGRRRLRYRTVSPETGGPASLVDLLPRIDPRGAVPLLEEMVDDDNPAIHDAAKQALAKLRAKGPQTH